MVHDYRRAMDFVQGRPGKTLIWNFGSFTRACFAEVLGSNPTQEERTAFMLRMGHTYLWHSVSPYREEYDGVETRRFRDGGEEVTEWRCPEGTLTERRREGQVVKFRIASGADLRVFGAMEGRLRIEPDAKAHAEAQRVAAGGPYGLPRQPLALLGEVSPVQRFLQVDCGVENFYALDVDQPELMKETLDLMQANQRRRYAIMQQFDCDVWFQGENTSTTLISPRYYERYSLAQISDFADFAHRAGKRAIVHMCGLLKGLLPLLRQTGMDGIHSLTPSPVGDTTVQEAYAVMPAECSILARINTGHWLNRSSTEILAELRQLFPARFFREHPLAIWVTLDSVPNIPRTAFDSLGDALLRYAGEVEGRT